MSDPYFQYTRMDGLSDGYPFSFAGTHSDPDRHTLGRTKCSAIHQASSAASPISPELQGNAFLPGGWPAALNQTPRAVPPIQFESFPFGVPIPSHATDNCPSHFGYSSSSACPLIYEDHPQTVAMSTTNGYDDGLMDAHGCHYDPSFGPVYDSYMVEDPSVIASPTIPMPTVRTHIVNSPSSYASVPTPSQSPCYHITSIQHVSPPNSILSPSPPGNFDFGPYSSSSPSLISQSFLAPPSKISDQNQPQCIVTPSIDQCYTITVPLDAIEFPPYPNLRELSFFKCCWEDCGVWITCDHEAVKDHMARIHNVALKGKTDDSMHCKWTNCSSSSRRSGMVRHLRTHFRLVWQCSVCKGTYTRTDSVRSHASREPQCKVAQAISYPSEMAYRARRIGDIVALTKVLQQAMSGA